MRRPYLALLTPLALALSVPPAQAQTFAVDDPVLRRIWQEGMEHSQLYPLAQTLLDSIGPRLTGSGGMRRANEWTAQTFRQWGLANVKIEPWDSAFGRGWERVNYSGRILEPFIAPLSAQPLAWSGSTRGTVTCPVVLLEVEDTTQLARYAGRLKGACVLRGAPREIPPEFAPIVRRFDADSLLAPPAPPRRPQGRVSPPAPAQRLGACRARRRGGGAG